MRNISSSQTYFETKIHKFHTVLVTSAGHYYYEYHKNKMVTQEIRAMGDKSVLTVISESPYLLASWPVHHVLMPMHHVPNAQASSAHAHASSASAQVSACANAACYTSVI